MKIKKFMNLSKKEIEDVFMELMKDVGGTGAGMPGGMPEGFDPSNMPDFSQAQDQESRTIK